MVHFFGVFWRGYYYFSYVFNSLVSILLHLSDVLRGGSVEEYKPSEGIFLELYVCE